MSPACASDKAIRTIAILGGGTAGWVAAAILAQTFRNRLQIVLVEADHVPIVGVGEATIPPILDLLRVLGVDEAEFIAATGGTYKLGIVFQDWNGAGHRYWHPFGSFGASINGRPFHHFWARAKAADDACDVAAYSAAAALGEAAKFAAPPAARAAGVRHALHFDAVLVGRYLRTLAENLGVHRLVAKVAGCTRAEDGRIAALVLADGRSVAADLFIDCSGFAAALIGGALGVPTIDYRQWLPCDRAVAAPSPVRLPRQPCTLAAAHEAGWRWRIPLQHRTGNGFVYCSAWLTDTAAADRLGADVPDLQEGGLRQLRFQAGRRTVFWAHNCVALGLAAGFLEPLESTSIQLVINGVFRLLDHFPDRDFAPCDIAAYNASVTGEFDAVRDFIILHYWLARRDDTEFWRHCAGMEVPEGLRARVALFREAGRIVPHADEMFSDLSWFFVLHGLGVIPRRDDALAALPAAADLLSVMTQLRARVAETVRSAPPHDSWFAASPAGATAPAVRQRA